MLWYSTGRHVSNATNGLSTEAPTARYLLVCKLRLPISRDVQSGILLRFRACIPVGLLGLDVPIWCAGDNEIQITTPKATEYARGIYNSKN